MDNASGQKEKIKRSSGHYSIEEVYSAYLAVKDNQLSGRAFV